MMYVSTRVQSAALAPTLAWTTPQGNVFTIRAIRPKDFAAMRDFSAGLSYSTRYLRFGQGDFELPDCELRHVCDPDPQVCTHLVALMTAGTQQRIVGSARYVVQGNGINAEFAIEVSDHWHHAGIGHRLMAALEIDARDRGLRRMLGQILASNGRMLDFVIDCGYEIHYHPEEAFLKLAIKKL